MSATAWKRPWPPCARPWARSTTSVAASRRRCGTSCRSSKPSSAAALRFAARRRGPAISAAPSPIRASSSATLAGNRAWLSTPVSPNRSPGSEMAMFDGRWNRQLGWAMLVVGFAGAVALDPWSLSERDPTLLVGSPRMAIRQTQAVVIGMAFLQLMVAQILSMASVHGRVQAMAPCLSALGALVYTAGYFLHVAWTGSPWLMVAGALLNFVAFALLALAGGVRQARRDVEAVLLVFCFGMLVDALMGLFAADPLRFLPDYIGRDDEVRPRMLRLARAAAIALPMLTFLYQGLATRQKPGLGVFRWGGFAMMFGSIGMPLFLI